MPIAPILESFARGTTMHGVPKAIRSRSLCGRVFWSVICVSAALMFSAQFAQLLAKYYAYPKKVTIEVVPSSVPFPAISLCNMRNLDIMILNELNNMFKNGSGPQQWRNMTSSRFIHEYLRVVSKYFTMFGDKSIDMSVFQTVLTRTTIATNIERDEVVAAGVPLKEFIVTCRFGGHDCDRSTDFHQFFDSYYYNCFTYVAPAQDDPDSTLAEGLENGWSTTILTGSGMLEKNEEIRMIPGTHERFSPMSSSEGVRVVIHPPNTTPYPHTEGFDIPPGYSVTLGVKARENIRIKAPHGNCLDNNPFQEVHDANESTHHEEGQYRLISCQKLCLQREITKRCGCKDIALPGHGNYPDLKFCSDDTDIPERCELNATEECVEALIKVHDRFLCVRNTSVYVTRNATQTRSCGCYPPCHEQSYDVTYSLSKWPAESFDGEEAYIDIFDTERYPSRFLGPEDRAKFELYGKYFDYVNRREAMQDFARLNVYIADSNVLKTEESEDYSQSQLLSDIGGQLGLWVGISVITLAEMLELFLDVVRYIFKSKGPNSKGKNFSRDPEYGQQRDVSHATARDYGNNHLALNCDNHIMCNGAVPLTALHHHQEYDCLYSDAPPPSNHHHNNTTTTTAAAAVTANGDTRASRFAALSPFAVAPDHVAAAGVDGSLHFTT